MSYNTILESNNSSLQEILQIVNELPEAAPGDDAAYEAGRKAEYDKFWDTFQQNGTRTYYPYYVFASGSFNFDNFYPKYDIRPVGSATYLFYNWNLDNKAVNVVGSLKQRLDECCVVLDTSQATNLSACFSYTKFTEIPTIDATATTNSTNLFHSTFGYLVTIEKIIVNENVTYSKWFYNCTGLANIVFEGVIGQDIDFSSCTKLTHDSLMSIINHLKDFTGTGTTKTLTIGINNLAKLTNEEKEVVKSRGWTLA